MVSVTLFSAVMLLAGILIYMSLLHPQTQGNKIVRSSNTVIYFIFMMTAAAIIRIVASARYPGHTTDMNCFSAWSDMIFKNGFSNFYTSDAFTDYPPGYMYILWIVGALKSVITNGAMVRLIIKLPAVLCDLATGYIVYKAAEKKFSDSAALIISGFYLFNPTIILNSSFWGQVDSVYTLLLLVMTLLIVNKKLIYSYIVFGLALFIKPQAFMFTPVVLFAMVEQLFMGEKENKGAEIGKNIISLVLSICVVFLLMLPFGIQNVIKQYMDTLSSYPYMTVNAFNIWAAFGQNWAGLTTISSILGYTFIALIVFASGYIFFNAKNPSKYYFTMGFIAAAVYMLSIKMHERYIFPAMVMFIMAYITMPSAQSFFTFFLTSVSQFINTAYILFVYEKSPNDFFRHPMVMAASWINVILLCALVYQAYTLYVRNKVPAVQSGNNNVNSVKKEVVTAMPRKTRIERSAVLAKITKFDIIAMVIIMAVYGVIAIYDLGDKTAPQNEYTLPLENDSIVLDMGEKVELDKIRWFLGAYENRKIDVAVSDDSSFNGTEPHEVEMVSVFAWKDADIKESGRYVKITAKKEKVMIKELALYNDKNELMVPVNASEFPGLFDEQEYVPERYDFRNSTYFDEIYHARTAYEFVHGLHVYEWTHPPLGKVIIAIGIKLFGMVPFGWRISGTVIGILMIPVIYAMIKKMFGHTYLAVIATLLFTFDFMHFAQTRIATIDVYGTFFIMLMYYFMFKYYNMSFYDTPLKKTFVPLALSGISMGLAAASKWTGVYATAGLALIFFISYIKRYMEYAYAKSNIMGETNGISHRYIVDNYKGFALKTFGWCCLTFIAVPLVIYVLSYIPYMMTEDANGLATVIKNQSDMLTYHGNTVLGSTHPYSSKWYEWIVMVRPIWYFSSTISDNIKEGISSFGNPAVWWVGIPAYLYVCYEAIRNKNKTAIFIMIGYLSQLIFWIPIERLTFIYHYFPSVPFLVMAIAFSVYSICAKYPKMKYAAFAYAGIAVILFAMFYPVLSGHPVNVDYVKDYLKWFSSWVLI